MMTVDTANKGLELELAQKFSNYRVHITYESRLKTLLLFVSYLMRNFTASRKLF